MYRSFTAAALVAIWFLINGADFLEDTNLIQYSSAAFDRSVEDVIDNFGEAVKTSKDERINGAKSTSRSPNGVALRITGENHASHALLSRLTKTTKCPPPHLEAYDFHQILLI